MCGAIHPLPTTLSWRGAPLKHKNIFTFTFDIGYEDVDCIQLAENRVQWWALVSKASIKGGDFFD
jgi:hypothetical protein